MQSRAGASRLAGWLLLCKLLHMTACSLTLVGVGLCMQPTAGSRTSHLCPMAMEPARSSVQRDTNVGGN
jgi:hypothetical protein